MKNLKYFSLITTFVIVSLLSLSSCAGAGSDTNDTVYLHVYNWADYIYQNDPEGGYTDPDMINQFEDYINTDEHKALYGLKKNVKVVYDTFDTPETMYNELKLNKTSYDMMCPSDYMIQKLALNLDGLTSTRIQKIDYSRLINYSKYVSPFLTDNLKAVNISETDTTKGTLYDYAVGYMWGTLGLVYNPGAVTLQDKGYTEEQVINDFSDPEAWNLLWNNDDYAHIASIKDSIRDTYSMGIMHVFSDEFKKLSADYSSGALTKEEYKSKMNSIFNRSDKDTVAKVQSALIALKDRIYGFEVDTGKTDIVTGKVGVNLAWSGDAVFSMDQADEYDQHFYYALPSLGANIWFDGWCIPESVSGDHLSAVYAFLDFLSMPKNAAANMNYIGYTPFIAGDEVLSQVHDWYDTEETEGVVDYDLSYFFNGTLNDLESDPIIHTDEEQTKRQLHAQYPEANEIDHLCIMKDFGINNDSIVAMWENVKVNPLPVWVTVIVLASIILFLAYLGSYGLIRKAKLKHRRELRSHD
jgi:spermidine/putrescine transport system substrate-binding protein